MAGIGVARAVSPEEILLVAGGISLVAGTFKNIDGLEVTVQRPFVLGDIRPEYLVFGGESLIPTYPVGLCRRQNTVAVSKTVSGSASCSPLWAFTTWVCS